MVLPRDAFQPACTSSITSGCHRSCYRWYQVWGPVSLMVTQYVCTLITS